MTSSPFFAEAEGYPLVDPFALAFLARLRQRAEAWEVDIKSTDTHTETIDNPVAVAIFVPGLSGRWTALWVLCQHHDGRPPTLEGSWGDRVLVGDDLGTDPRRDLTLSGAPATAEELADLAARWFDLHLRMDIYRDEWSWGSWSRRDAFDDLRSSKFGFRKLTRSVVERSGGHSTGDHLT